MTATQLALELEETCQTEVSGRAAEGRTAPFEVDERQEPLLAQLVALICGDRASPDGVAANDERLIDLTHYAERLLALEWYADASERYRTKAPASDARHLFVMAIGENFQLATPHWYTGWFKEFGHSLPGLLSAVVTPSMIRPSVLLKAALENDGRLQVGRAIGQHGQAVTRGYQEKLPIRLLRDQHMRRFQRHYETRVLQNVITVAHELGIESDEFEKRVAELQATGLGTHEANSPVGLTAFRTGTQ